MTRLELREHEAAEFDLPDRDAEALIAAGAVERSSSRRSAPGRWRLKAGSRVGVVRVGDTELWLLPKVTIGRLLYLASYGQTGRKSYQWRDDEVDLGEAEGLVPAMARLFVKQASRAFHDGVLQGYREYEEALYLLRGRLRAGDQARRHPGQPLPVEVRYDDLTADILENRILLTAIRRLSGLPAVPPTVQRELVQLTTRLPSVAELPAGQPVPQVQPTRLNVRYDAALRLATIVLQDNSVEHRTGDARVTGFLLDMHQVFQDYLVAVLRERLGPLGGVVTAQHQEILAQHEDQPVVLKPDVVWRRHHAWSAVIDAKYKATGDHGTTGTRLRDVTRVVLQADLYQMFTYCKVLGLSRGHLVHVDPLVPRRQTLRIADVEIEIHSLDLGLRLDQLKEQADELAASVTRG
jgi:5-methylcytosine-specific restriction enzyme subunit McrC